MFKFIKRFFDNPAIPLGQAYAMLSNNRSTSGAIINRDTVMGLPALRRATNLISSAIARLPIETYHRGDNGSRIRAKDHQAYYLLKSRPSPLYGAFSWKQAAVLDVLLHGNSYHWISRQGAKPVEFVRLDPTTTYPLFVNGELVYSYLNNNGVRKPLLMSNILHFKNIGDGLQGISVVDSLRESLGLAVALQKYTSTYFRYGANPSIIIESPVQFKTKEETDEFLRRFEERHMGLDNAGRVGLLLNGMKISNPQISNESAQLLASREFSIKDIANAIGIDAQKLGAAINTSYSSLEWMGKAFLSDLEPFLVMMEEELEFKTLTEEEKKSGEVYIEFNRDSMEKPDSKTDSDIWTDKLNNGKCTLNQYLEANNLPTIDEDFANWHRMPANLVFAEQKPAEPAEPVAPVDSTEPVSDGTETPAEAVAETQLISDNSEQSKQRYITLLSLDVERNFERLRKAITAKIEQPFFERYLDSEEFLHHRDVFAKSIPFAEKQIDDYLEGLINELKAVTKEQRAAVLNSMDSKSFCERVI